MELSDGPSLDHFILPLRQTTFQSAKSRRQSRVDGLDTHALRGHIDVPPVETG
jgi:hypothetical protein